MNTLGGDGFNQVSIPKILIKEPLVGGVSLLKEDMRRLQDIKFSNHSTNTATGVSNRAFL